MQSKSTAAGNSQIKQQQKSAYFSPTQKRIDEILSEMEKSGKMRIFQNSIQKSLYIAFKMRYAQQQGKSRYNPPITTQLNMPTNSQPVLSVIVPVYNSGAFLLTCIESMAAQDCGAAVEFICVNDGSTDGSPQELEAWAARDSRVRVLHQPNGGYGKAMNAGLMAARGEYIGIVEPDDWVEPHMCRTLLALAEQTQADIVKGCFAEEYEGSSHADARFKSYREGAIYAPLDMPDFLLGAPGIWTAIYSKAMIDASGIRFNETPGASYQDLGFFMRTWAAAKSIAITPKVLYHYRKDNPASSTRRREEGAWALLREIAQTRDLFDSLGDEERARRTILIRRVFHSLAADYKLRVNETLRRWLQECSRLLHQLCPPEKLLPEYFSREEWHDISILYHHPGKYPRLRKMGASVLQRIFSIRTEGGRRYIRILGGKFRIGKQTSKK